MSADEPILDREARRAAVAHLNDDHPEDTLFLCRRLGGVPTATAAHAVDIDEHQLILEAHAPGGRERIHLPFAEPILERSQVRREVVRLYERARDTGPAPGAPR